MSHKWEQEFTERVMEMADGMGLDSSELKVVDFLPYINDEGYDWEGIEKHLEELAIMKFREEEISSGVDSVEL